MKRLFGGLLIIFVLQYLSLPVLFAQAQTQQAVPKTFATNQGNVTVRVEIKIKGEKPQVWELPPKSSLELPAGSETVTLVSVNPQKGEETDPEEQNIKVAIHPKAAKGVKPGPAVLGATIFVRYITKVGKSAEVKYPEPPPEENPSSVLEDLAPVRVIAQRPPNARDMEAPREAPRRDN